MRPVIFLISAYAVVWFFVVIYVLSLGLRLREMRKDIEVLKKK